MYAPPASASNDSPYANGHLSPHPAKPELISAVTSDSESALSEALDDPAVLPLPTSIEKRNGPSNDEDADSDMESSNDEDALGSDDPEYNMETPPPQIAESSRDARSTSQESPRQRKRKTGVDNEGFMLNDPELYGLRRSVSESLYTRAKDAHLLNQGRPRQAPQMVDALDPVSYGIMLTDCLRTLANLGTTIQSQISHTGPRGRGENLCPLYPVNSEVPLDSQNELLIVLNEQSTATLHQDNQ